MRERCEIRLHSTSCPIRPTILQRAHKTAGSTDPLTKIDSCTSRIKSSAEEKQSEGPTVGSIETSHPVGDTYRRLRPTNGITKTGNMGYDFDVWTYIASEGKREAIVTDIRVITILLSSICSL